MVFAIVVLVGFTVVIIAIAYLFGPEVGRAAFALALGMSMLGAWVWSRVRKRRRQQ